jgi:hypothetical protein
MKKIVHTALSLFATSSAMATEIAPTPKMLAEAKQMIKIEYPDDDAQSYEYHFRNLGGHILWCAHASRGNGGFCTKITPRMVADTDRAAGEYCKTADADEGAPPHAVYGELWDLNYKCARCHMSRLPAEMAIDSEGYVRGQWKSLP